jgi:predicted nucleic acid-binding protein
LPSTVLDSSAVLALLFDEPAAEKVENILAEAAEENREVLISAVNWAEVLYRIRQIHGDAGVEAARQFELESPLRVAEVDRSLAELAAQLKESHSLSLSDAICAALAKQEGAVLVTADRDFEAMKGKLKKIIWLSKG